MYTGERILPHDVLRVTHQQSLVAYQLASDLARGKTVLDVACGEGYGLQYLAKFARAVVGIDYNAGTVDHIRRTYHHPTLEVRQGDLFHLAEVVPGQLFDVVCFFQAIEHFADQDAVLMALKSVTRPGGAIVISTPNRDLFPTFNPYHVRELNYAELTELMQRHFSDFTIHGVFGDDVVMNYRRSKGRIGAVILRLDVLRAREWLPAPVIQKLYSLVSFFIIKRLSFWQHRRAVVQVSPRNFSVKTSDLEQALDFIVVATR